MNINIEMIYENEKKKTIKTELNSLTKREVFELVV